MNYATDKQISFISSLLRNKFNISENLSKNYCGILLVNNNEQYKYRLTTSGKLDKTNLDTKKASGIIATLLDKDHKLENNKWMSSSNCYIQLIERSLK